MATHNEAADGAVKDRVATGIHAVAGVVLGTGTATFEELKLAEKILLRDPNWPNPREHEGIAECFNRQMDAAIESCNASAHCPTRAARRQRLARDLDAAGVLLVDRDYLAGLIADRLTLEIFGPPSGAGPEGEDLGAELLDGDVAYGPVPYGPNDYELVGDVGRDPLGGCNPNVND